ncbi:hypothetical protein [Shinella lacus]|uniref:hypothetical protein n=1 Tax=Shinella lacus TaxID=2654216 RepID=UPI00210A92AC|nr:hypothetical protein [Shinella lacus]
MAIIPNEPTPGPVPIPDLPPIDNPSPPIEEPEPDRLPDENPDPNPDENDRPPKHVNGARIVLFENFPPPGLRPCGSVQGDGDLRLVRGFQKGVTRLVVLDVAVERVRTEADCLVEGDAVLFWPELQQIGRRLDGASHDDEGLRFRIGQNDGHLPVVIAVHIETCLMLVLFLQSQMVQKVP